MNLGDIKKALLDGGVVGAGGAGFPTYAKLSDQAETIILNAAECEPLIKSTDSFWLNIQTRFVPECRG